MRPVNLVIIAVTMLVIRFVLIVNHLKWEPAVKGLTLPLTVFVASVFVMVLLAASGNIINDYFDQKVDRINKPDRVIIGRHVKRRVAIILHHALNILAVGLTAYICSAMNYWWPVIIPVVMATLLWFYSPVFKKQPFIGNFVVALCVAVVPFWASWFEISALNVAYSDGLFAPVYFFNQLWYRIIAYCGFAFLITLAREAVKDLEDLEGDRAEGFKTLPVVWGAVRTSRYASMMIAVSVLAVAFFAAQLYIHGQYGKEFLAASAALIVILGYTAAIVARSEQKNQYTRASKWLKFSMACGIAYLFFI
ncbi:MAG: hypothetical protein RL220_293 [Bacteroidota bacterium]